MRQGRVVVSPGIFTLLALIQVKPNIILLNAGFHWIELA